MPNVEWILGSILSLSGWRLDILLVRVTIFARVLFVGVAYAVSPLAPRLTEPREYIDAAYEVRACDASEPADVLADWRVC